MNFYDILNIDKSATEQDIKKAYKNLAKKYHPDKNKDKDTTEMFKEINMAYEVLKDKDKRYRYDLLSATEKIELYSTFKHMFSYLNKDNMNPYNNFVKYFFDNEKDLEDDFNKMAFNKIYGKIYNKLNNTSISEIDSFINLFWDKKLKADITINLKITLDDVYKNKFKKITVNNNQHDNEPIYIPIRETEIIYPEKGNIVDNKKGKVIVNIEHVDYKEFAKINENDLMYLKDITLHDYLYGTNISFKHMDDEIIKLDIPSCIDIVPIFTIKGKGLPYSNVNSIDSDIDISDDLNNINYGDLYVWVKIIGINDKIYNINNDEEHKKNKEWIKKNFPVINKDE